MTRGQVNADRDAVITLQVHASDGDTEAVEAVIDTGFSGFLTLPPTLIATLELPFWEAQTFTLGDNSDVVFNVHVATLLWEGQDREVFVLATEGGALVGMSLLYGYRLTVDVVDGGDVTIEPRP